MTSRFYKTAGLCLCTLILSASLAFGQSDRGDTMRALHSEIRNIDGVHIELVDGRPTLCGHVMRVEDRRKIDSILLRYPSTIDAVSSAIVNRDEVLVDALKVELSAYPTLNIIQTEKNVTVEGKVFSQKAAQNVRDITRVYYPEFKDRVEVVVPKVSVRMSLLKVRTDLKFKNERFDKFTKQKPTAAVPVRKYTFERLSHDRIITSLVDSGCCTLIYTRAFGSLAGRAVAVSANKKNWGDLVFRLDLMPYESGIINSEIAAFVSSGPNEPRYYKKFNTVTAPRASVAVAGLLPVFAGAEEIDITGFPSFRPFFQQGKRLNNTEMLVVYTPALETK